MQRVRPGTVETCPICGTPLVRLPAGCAVKCPNHGIVGEVRETFAPIVTEPTIVAQRVTALAMAMYQA